MQNKYFAKMQKRCLESIMVLFVYVRLSESEQFCSGLDAG